ncbi:GNAT family N-acetyltransferase [Halalkalibacterium halodurans]|uniref:GNAT family N-acetyltransferase n=1 Tax=Halalkalibacterium halodurans TaxID=86665 RepID=UPI002E1CDA90|nr:GNAT family N-acetyltransferase [Halalkalibacterium halodurans]
MMAIIQLNESHYDEVLNLSSYAFQYPLTQSERQERAIILKEQDIYGIFYDEQLAAKLHIYPFQIWFNGQKIEMGGIAGVATYPEYRRQGFVKDLLLHSLREMRRNGQSVSILHPFSIPFYRKYGWELFSYYVSVDFSVKELVLMEEPSGYMRRRTAKATLAELRTIYDEYAKTYSGILDRKDSWWQQKVVNDCEIAIYYTKEGSPTGYILYQVKDAKMIIDEFVALQHEARLGLWNFICQHDSMVQTITITLQEHDPLLYTCLHVKERIEQKPFGMVRIVDVQRFLTQCPFLLKENDEPLFLHVLDKQAPWNRGVFKLTEGTCTKVDEFAGNRAVVIEINHLSALLFGYKTVGDLLAIEAVNGPEGEIVRLAQMIPRNRPLLLDFF